MFISISFYFLHETSGSMEWAKIGALNDAMSNIVSDLRETVQFNNATILMSVLTFGKTAKWMNDTPISITDFSWTPIQASGMTPLGMACLELNNRIKADITDASEDIYIIVLSDGCPTDDYDEGIEALKKNVYYKKAKKFAIAIGEDADLPSLLRFVNDDSHIFKQNRADGLLNILQNILYKTTKIRDKSAHNIQIEEEDEWA